MRCFIWYPVSHCLDGGGVLGRLDVDVRKGHHPRLWWAMGNAVSSAASSRASSEEEKLRKGWSRVRKGVGRRKRVRQRVEFQAGQDALPYDILGFSNQLICFHFESSGNKKSTVMNFEKSKNIKDTQTLQHDSPKSYNFPSENCFSQTYSSNITV